MRLRVSKIKIFLDFRKKCVILKKQRNKKINFLKKRLSQAKSFKKIKNFIICHLKQPFFFLLTFFYLKKYFLQKLIKLKKIMNSDKNKLIYRLKQISKKPDLKIYISKIDKKKRKRVIINNRKEFSEKYLYL